MCVYLRPFNQVKDSFKTYCKVSYLVVSAYVTQCVHCMGLCTTSLNVLKNETVTQQVESILYICEPIRGLI